MPAQRRRTTSTRSGAGSARGKSGARKRPPAKKSTASARRRAPARSAAQQRQQSRQMRDATGLVLVALSLYLAGVLTLGWDGGALGFHVSRLALLLVGQAALVLPVVGLALGVLIIARSELVDPGPFRAGIYLFVPSVLLAFGADRFGLGDGTARSAGFAAERVVDHGGYLGAAFYSVTYQLFGEAGTTIVCVLGLVLGLLFLTGSSIQAIAGWWLRRIGGAAVSARDTTRHVAHQATQGFQALRSEQDGGSGVFDGRGSFPDIFGDVPAQFAVHVDGDELGPLEQEAPTPAPAAKKRTAKRAKAAPAEDQIGMLEHLDEPAGELTEVLSEDLVRARVAERTGGYRLPDPKLLDRGESSDATVNPADVDRTKVLLVDTFGHFGIKARVTGMVPGPRVSRYELSLAPGTKMSKVENLRKDLAYALATTEIRILAPIPGKSAVGIEVENPKPALVTMGDVWHKPPKGSSPLYVYFGKDISGKNIGADLAKMPHLLVAGTTGAGKSGCMNAIMSSILLGATPDQVKLLLIDPKKVELSTYEGIPHLLTPVVTNMKKAANALGNVISQMEERYSAMEIAGARTLTDFNRILAQRGEDPLPYILIVIDELADLVMQAKGDVEDAVIRLAQKGRAAGFHMVLATQRPSVDVITGMIKSNVPSRIAFAVSSQTDSRVILDQNGAETLLGQGDMLFKPVWARTPQRVQGAWIGEPEVRLLCEAAREQRAPSFDIDLLSDPDPVAQDEPDFVDQDDRIAEAIRLVAEFQTCSASFFQRRMRVGYTRGARLVDMLERRGIVAPGEGPRPRNVLITIDDLDRVLGELDAAPAEAAEA